MSSALATLVAKGDDSTAADIASPYRTLHEETIARCARLSASTNDGGRSPSDPVARFHLANGARLERLNWMGDSSAAGLRRWYGMTVNYVYRLADLERNHDAYASQFAWHPRERFNSSRSLVVAEKSLSLLCVS